MNPSPLERLWEFIKVQLRLCLGSKPDVLYIRWHLLLGLLRLGLDCQEYRLFRKSTAHMMICL